MTGYPNRCAGYTFAEMLIVLAIVGFASTLAIPAYQDYTTRVRVAEVFSLIGPVQRAVARYYASTGKFPANNRAAGLPRPNVKLGKHVAGITIADGAATAKFQGGYRLDGAVLTFRPVVMNASTGSNIMSWLCGFATAPASAVTGGENNTTVERRYLPSACR